MDHNNIIVLIILAVTVILLVFEIFRADLVALLCLLALGWSGALEMEDLLSGFSSTAVVVMMAVMILGRGIDKTGVMDRFARWVLTKSGSNKQKITGVLSISIGMISGFIQNIGAIALFLPGVINISRRLKIHLSELIMPLGFAAILGGTLTMVGSGPLILINDLLCSAGLQPYNIFSVTPIGILLLLAGTGYFLLFGKYILPRSSKDPHKRTTQEKLIETLDLPHQVWHYLLPVDSPMIGKTLEETGVWDIAGVHILGVTRGKEVEYAPWRQSRFEAGQELALLGDQKSIEHFAANYRLIQSSNQTYFKDLHDPDRSGFTEVIVPHGSEIIGKTLRQYALRKRYVVEPVVLFSKGEEITGDFSDHTIIPGDALIVHGLWERLAELKNSLDFVVATPFEIEKKDKSKVPAALVSFAAAILLSLIGFPIALSFLTGALAMVLLKVLDIQEAYRSIEWKVVFLLAGLIPLGIAMQKTGTAAILAENLINLVLGRHVFLLVLMVGILSTVFSLVMTNVGAIVVLAPLVIEMATIAGVDPRPLVLLAAICVANSFILPTHQVNAFIVTPGNYRSADFVKAGSGMTLLFLLLAVGFFYLFII